MSITGAPSGVRCPSNEEVEYWRRTEKYPPHYENIGWAFRQWVAVLCGSPKAIEALRPFAALGGPDDGFAVAFHDLPLGTTHKEKT